MAVGRALHLVVLLALTIVVSGGSGAVSYARNSNAHRVVQRLEEKGLKFSDVEKRVERKRVEHRKETRKTANCPPPEPEPEAKDPLTNALEMRILLIDRLNNSIHMWSIKEMPEVEEDVTCN